MSLPHDPRWPRASAWIYSPGAQPAGSIGVIGAPVHLGSITPGRCDLAPAAIRAALARFSTYDLAADRDLRDLAAYDFGDLEVAGMRLEQAFRPIRVGVQAALEQVNAVVLLGGDNGITRGGCHGVHADIAKCGLLTLDAHLDLRDLDGGLSNGNPVRALLADGLPGHQIAQIGLQSFSNSQAYRQVARDAGITVIPVDEVHAQGIDTVVCAALKQFGDEVEAIYVDLDLDVLDRSFAPAAPGSRPGGLAPWQIRLAARLCGTHPKVRVLDLVEIDPERDVADATVLAAAACLLSFASGVLCRTSPL